ncbi:MAG TPA: tyrosine-type recombinase/integrase [Acidimicrobiales bacterium]|nr:tyrosine-type recombinase/integrase [Acidimicrobiales bacterium]
MNKRRGAGEGSVYQMQDGRWRGAIDLGLQNGRRVRKVVTAETRAKALSKLHDKQRELDQGVQADAKMTVGKLLDRWLGTVVDGRVGSDNTRANYEQIVRVHLKPALGNVRLDELSAEQVDDFLRAKVAEGKGRLHIARMRSLLANALSFAEARHLVRYNAASLSMMPRTEAPVERQSLTPDEARALLAAAQGERLEALVVVGGSVGLRPGELTGLLWADLDLDGTPPTLTVSGSLKRTAKLGGGGYTLTRGAVKRSKDGLRTVALPPRAIAALRVHKRQQAAERLAAGPLWQDHGLVFSSEVGTPIDPSHLRRVFARIARRAGLEGPAFVYLLRHTAVSLLLDDGASIEEVADLLGDDPRTLYRYYRHKVRPVADASLRMERVLGNQAAGDE